MNKLTQQSEYQEINKWLEKTIVGLNLCPFARIPFENKQIKITIQNSSDFENAYIDFIEEVEDLSSSEQFNTTLLVYPQLEVSFEDFNDFIGELEFRLEECELDSQFQLVGFHPQFYFADTVKSDLANYVNRSPFPLIHILQRKDIDKAISSLQMGENISFTNENTIKNLSPEQIQEHFWYLFK